MEAIQKTLTERFNKNQEEAARKNREAIEESNRKDLASIDEATQKIEGRMNRFRDDQNQQNALMKNNQDNFFDEIRGMMATLKDKGKTPIAVDEEVEQQLGAGGLKEPPLGAGGSNEPPQVMDIDSVGTFTMCHEALKYLKKGGPGRKSSSGGLILNISATLHYTASWYQIHVSAAKAAVDATTRNLALEWGTDYDIRVNGIAPGPIGDTPGMSKLAPEEITSKAKDYMPLYKLGEKWDIAMAAVYLASDAGKYVNGSTLPVDGGLWLSRPRHLPKDAVKELSRVVEKKSRSAPVGLPKSKLATCPGINENLSRYGKGTTPQQQAPRHGRNRHNMVDTAMTWQQTL
uniref:2,4-dienoyl-CoA reductase [(3E)-enoyl-CoA-producing] n=1 Tax=Chenopodium quinoa TaxID=63459 RepID=A0A803N5J3_CHEQI